MPQQKGRKHVPLDAMPSQFPGFTFHPDATPGAAFAIPNAASSSSSVDDLYRMCMSRLDCPAFGMPDAASRVLYYYVQMDVWNGASKVTLSMLPSGDRGNCRGVYIRTGVNVGLTSGGCV